MVDVYIICPQSYCKQRQPSISIDIGTDIDFVPLSYTQEKELFVAGWRVAGPRLLKHPSSDIFEVDRLYCRLVVGDLHRALTQGLDKLLVGPLPGTATK